VVIVPIGPLGTGGIDPHAKALNLFEYPDR